MEDSSEEEEKSSEEDSKTLEQELDDAVEEDLSKELEASKKEAAEYLDALKRERADFINFRNRISKEREQFKQAGVEDAFKALLPVLDDMDRIREHGKMDSSLKAVSKQMDKALSKLGIEKFGEPGEAFDPSLHEAVLHNPKEGAQSDSIEAVVEAGYRIGGKILRAARVVVSSPLPEGGAAPEGGSEAAAAPEPGA
ncbi:MAG: nucleotide exchange factor GrpE [Aeriscardovia sp.]|nr:nucleotide exchange factor GrpE [Aeriscardovia sp.]